MFRRLVPTVLIALLGVAAHSTLQAQPATHLNVPVKQLVRVQFNRTPGEPNGYYTAKGAVSVDGASGSNFIIPAGMSLVITDLMLTGTTPANYTGDNTGQLQVGWFDSSFGYFTSILWSDVVKLPVAGPSWFNYGWSRSFTAGFRVPAVSSKKFGIYISLPWANTTISNERVVALGYLISDN